jgi:hypothetical protein
MFMTVFAFPSMGKKRQLANAYKLVPRWYRIASKFLIIATMLLGGTTMCMGLGYYVSIAVS